MLKVMFSGNLTADPVMSDKVDCCNFTVACRTAVIENGSPKTEFIRVAVWGKRGHSCAEYLKKGNYVSGTGDMDVSTYVGNDGDKRYNVNVRNGDIEFGPKSNGGNSNASSSSSSSSDDDDDMFNS